MSSINKFGSGLNNWAATDKPVREDFNNDNQILTENAMWKATYDADGVVEAAEGIESFVDQKLASTAGFVVYTHSKTGTQHNLVNSSASGDNIKFIATADFVSGDTLKIDGTTVTVLDCDGNAVGKAWKDGDTVSMFRNNNTVRVTAPLSNKANLVSGAVPVSQGGTGGVTAKVARDNLSVYSKNEVNGWVQGNLTFTNVSSAETYGRYAYNKVTGELRLQGAIIGSALSTAAVNSNNAVMSLMQIPDIVLPTVEAYVYGAGSVRGDVTGLILKVTATGNVHMHATNSTLWSANSTFSRTTFNVTINTNAW